MSVAWMAWCDNPGCTTSVPTPVTDQTGPRFTVKLEAHRGTVPWPGGESDIRLDFCGWACLLAYVNEL